MRNHSIFTLSLLLLCCCYGKTNSKFSDNTTDTKKVIDNRPHLEKDDQIISQQPHPSEEDLTKTENNDAYDSVEYETVQHVKGMCFNNGNSEYYIYFLVGAQFITPEYSINTRLKPVSDTEFDIYFYNVPVEPSKGHITNAFKDYSENVPIAKADHRDNTLRLTWYGFYDTKIKKRVYTENPFDKTKETVTLRRCTE